MNEPSIYLASRSPRRRELLAQIGVAFTVVDVAVDESIHAHEAPADYVERLAVEKARAGLAATAHAPPLPVLGADTVVLLDDEVLGKPDDEDRALAMLERLSGRRHHVLSAVALATPAGVRVRLDETAVTFRAVSPAERAAYVATGEPRDKAGGYAIQGLAGIFATRIEGSYTGVVGLPLHATAELLAEAGVAVLPAPPETPRPTSATR